MSTLKVLLIEDNQADAHLIRLLLAKNKTDQTDLPPEFEVLHVNRLAAGLAYLEQMNLDIILLDLSLPDSHGTETFKRTKEKAPHTPIVVLSGLDDENVAVKAMQLGAQDYLVKGTIEGDVLERAIRYAIERQTLLTELQQKTKALETSESYRRKIVDNNADGIIIVGEDNIVKFVNPATERILERTQQDLIGQPLGLSTESTQMAKFDVLRHDGKTAVIETRFTEIEWQGEPARQVSLRDITEHVQAKAKLTQQAMELQHRNAELDEFAHTVAHQVQGLLGQIIGYSSFIEMNWGEDIDEQAQLALKRVLQSSHKMNNVLSEILLLASVDRSDIETMPLDMGRIVSEAKKRLSFDINEYKADIQHENDWPQALGYTSWIEEVWVNYISNGLKYGGDPPVLKLGADPSQDGMIRFWVQDNGAGISPIDQTRLFKPHTRLRQTRARGEGLGLSIVRRIVEKCGGKVGVDSELGHGSTFWFCLPHE
ncbi:MAG: response regulator [Anaerolineae bacterium]|nr:response regulator [Anaerolineae bacterium]